MNRRRRLGAWLATNVERRAITLSLLLVLVAMALFGYGLDNNAAFSRCVARWGDSFSTISKERAAAHDAIQAATDSLIRDLPGTESTDASVRAAADAKFQRDLQAYIATSNQEVNAERAHPLPAEPTLEC